MHRAQAADEAQVAAYGESQRALVPPPPAPAPSDSPGLHSFQQQLEKDQLAADGEDR